LLTSALADMGELRHDYVARGFIQDFNAAQKEEE
jgi:hypothetical protein